MVGILCVPHPVRGPVLKTLFLQLHSACAGVDMACNAPFEWLSTWHSLLQGCSVYMHWCLLHRVHDTCWSLLAVVLHDPACVLVGMHCVPRSALDWVLGTPLRGVMLCAL